MGVVLLRKPFILSLLFHAALMIGVGALLSRESLRAQKQKTFTYIDLESSLPQKPKLKAAKEDSSRKRVVQTEIRQKTEKAAPDAFLGKQNQIIDRQTVSKNKLVATANSSTPKPAAPKEEPKPQDPERKPRVAEKHTTPQLKELSKFGLAIIPKAKPPGEDAKEPQRDRRYPEMPRDAATPGSPQDYVKGLKEAETTALNTKEFVFYGYYQRIRQKLDYAWNSTLRENLNKLYRRGRRLASDMDHTTRIMVTLNSTGEVVRVQLMEESGTLDLDDAAVRAFNKAGPFPNPPHGILDQAGKIEIRWDFVLKT